MSIPKIKGDIPREIVQKKSWQKGDTITISFNERGNVELAKVRR